MAVVDFLSVECRVRDGHAVWKNTLKPAASGKPQSSGQLARTTSGPLRYESEHLLDVIRHMERIFGTTVSSP